jgi:WD40 repeat protein
MIRLVFRLYLVTGCACGLFSGLAGEAAAAGYPPQLTEVAEPGGVSVYHPHPMIAAKLADFARTPIPSRLADAVAWVRPYREFGPSAEGGLITLEITADGPVYLAVNWEHDGNLDEATQAEVWNEPDLAGRGWMAVSLVGLAHRDRDAAETHIVYARYCRNGEKFKFRTRKRSPPIVLKLPDDRLSPDGLAALEPDEGMPEELRRSFVGAKALNLAAERRYEELERWAGGLLSSGAVFPSGESRIRWIARGFQLHNSSHGPEHYERHLPAWRGWLAAYPESNAVRLGLASILIEYSKSLRLRNTGAAREADVDDARRGALELLYEVEQRDPKLPHTYLQYMLLAAEEEWDEELTTEYFRRSVEAGAWCPQAVGKFISHLDQINELGEGEFRDKVRKHLESAVAATRASHGDQMYAASIKDNWYSRADYPLRALGYDWPRLRASFEELLAAGPPSRQSWAAYARLAAAAGDKPTARRLFEKLGPYRREDSAGWSNTVEYELNRIWTSNDFASGDQRAIFDLSAAGAVGLVWNDDGPRYLDRQGTIYALELQTGAQSPVSVRRQSTYLSFASSPDSEVMVCGSLFGRVGIYRKSKRGVHAGFTHDPVVTAVDVSRDGKFAAFARPTGQITVLDVTSERLSLHNSRTFDSGPIAWVAAVKFMPAGDRLVTYVENEAAIWNVETFRREAAWKTGTGPGAMAAVSPNGQILATVEKRFVRFWSLPDGKPLGSIAMPPVEARAVRFSPDGRRLAVGTGNYEALAPSVIHLIDVQAMQILKTYGGHKCSITGVAFSPDGRSLLSVSLDRSARVWDVPE